MSPAPDDQYPPMVHIETLEQQQSEHELGKVVDLEAHIIVVFRSAQGEVFLEPSVQDEGANRRQFAR